MKAVGMASSIGDAVEPSTLYKERNLRELV
jgi:hypothetical protein